MHDAQQYAGQDNLRRDAIELTGEAQRLANQVQQILKAQGKQMEKQEKKQIKNDVALLQKYLSKFRLDKVTEADMENIRQAKAALEQSAARWLNRGMES